MTKDNEQLTPIIHTCPSCRTTTECAVAPRVHAWETKLNEIHKVVCGDPFAKDPDGMVHIQRRHDEELKKLKRSAGEYAMDKAKATGAVAVIAAVAGVAGAWLSKKLGL
jgi:hypothetical protein